MNHLGSFEPGTHDTPSQSPAILVVAGARRFRAPPPLSAERPRFPSNHWSTSPQVRQSESPKVRQSASPKVRQSESPPVRKSASPKVRKSASLQVCKSASLQVRQSASLPVCKSASLPVCKSASPPTHFVRSPDSESPELGTFGLSDFRTFGLSDFRTFGLSDFRTDGRYRQTEFANRAARPARERASSVAASQKPSAIAHSSAHSTSMAEARAMRKNRCWLAEPRSYALPSPRLSITLCAARLH